MLNAPPEKYQKTSRLSPAAPSVHWAEGLGPSKDLADIAGFIYDEYVERQLDVCGRSQTTMEE
jgi:hypothetical protein